LSAGYVGVERYSLFNMLTNTTNFGGTFPLTSPTPIIGGHVPPRPPPPGIAAHETMVIFGIVKTNRKHRSFQPSSKIQNPFSSKTFDINNQNEITPSLCSLLLTANFKKVSNGVAKSVHKQNYTVIKNTDYFSPS